MNHNTHLVPACNHNPSQTVMRALDSPPTRCCTTHTASMVVVLPSAEATAARASSPPAESVGGIVTAPLRHWGLGGNYRIMSWNLETWNSRTGIRIFVCGIQKCCVGCHRDGLRCLVNTGKPVT
jgi:hypothetical protein